MFEGIRGKILKNYLILIVLMMVVLSFILVIPVENYFKASLEKELIREATSLSYVFVDELEKGAYQEVEEQIGMMSLDSRMRVTMVLPDGTVVADSHYAAEQMDNHLYREEIREAAQTGLGQSVRYSDTLKEEMMYVSIPVKSSAIVLAYIRIAFPFADFNSVVSQLRYIIFGAFFVAIVLASFMGVRVSKRLTEPIVSITEEAKTIAGGDYSRRVFENADDEIGDLGYALNILTENLSSRIKEISEEKGTLENILRTMASAVIVIDGGKNITGINRAAEELFGLRAEEVMDRSFLESVRNYDLQEALEQAIVSGENSVTEIRLLEPSSHLLQSFISLIRDDSGSISGATLVFYDVTEMKKLAKLKTEFVANASHELRTPLTVIRGYAETLLAGAGEDKEMRDRFLNIILSESKRMQELADDLMLLSKVESGQAVSEKAETDFSVIVSDAAENMRGLFNEKKIGLNIDIDVDKKVTLKEEYLRQVVVNLVSNAWKYTESGGSVSVRGYVAAGQVLLEVEDTGIGIPQEDTGRIFERFYRVDKSRTKDSGGTGLGLSIVKNIMERTGGGIYVESRPGEGSRFTAVFPAGS